jgi:uncharacterized protein YggE
MHSPSSRVAALLPLVFACAPVAAQQPAPLVAPVAVPPQVVTSGRGEAKLAPDRATIEVGVQTRAATAAAAAADNARKQRAVIDTLRKLGLAQEQISTVNFNVYPETRYDQPTQTSRVTGYVVSNSVRAEVRRLEQIGTLIDAALASGANAISSLSFYASNTDDARRQALSQAVAKARQDAETLARAAGGALGELLELTTVEYQPPRPLVMATLQRAAADAAPTPIEPGEQTLAMSVTARWRFIQEARSR